MSEGRQTKPEGKQTASCEGWGGTSDSSPPDSDTNMPEDISDFVVHRDNIVEINDSDPHEDFKQAIEPFFLKAVNSFPRERFDLGSAKYFVQVLRDLRQRYHCRGCHDHTMEEIVLGRALITVQELVDGVQLSKEEVHDPRQTLTYLYCALAVFPNSVQLRKESSSSSNNQGDELYYHLSAKGSLCLPLLDQLIRYCCIKAAYEGDKGWQTALHHNRLLLDLATWLDMETSSITYLITNKSMPLLNGISHLPAIAGISHLPAMAGFGERLHELWEMGVVLAASALIRQGFMQTAAGLHRLLAAVDTSSLPCALVTRHAYLYARLLQNCGEHSKALQYAQDALQGVTDLEEKWDIERLIMELSNSLEKSSQPSPVDPRWLEGTHALKDQDLREVQNTVRQQHVYQARRKKAKRVAVRKRNQTPSPARSQAPESSTAAAGSHGNSQSSTLSSSLSLYSSSRATYDTDDVSAESLMDLSDLDDSDEFEDDVEINDRDISLYGFEAEDEKNTLVAKSLVDCDVADERDWFEKSKQAMEDNELEEEQGEEIKLSERLKNRLENGGRRYPFYPDWVHSPENLLRSNPKKYKRCQIKIEWSHKSIAKVLDKGSKYSEILIEGRSKAGRTYMDDEVVVEILAEPGQKKCRELTTGVSDFKVPYGKVVGLLKRGNYGNVEHPVLFCTLDEVEGHLMRPLCKTVPKIHVMNDQVQKKYPALKKHRIEIKSITPSGDVVHKGFCDVLPDKRELYVFRVAILAWRQQNIYPLGAVLDALIGGKDYSGGIKVLSMQQRLPKYYPRTVVNDTERLLQKGCIPKTGRLDLTTTRLFTIDPPGSKDIDDAVSIKQEGSHYEVGVHIADVAALIEKDSVVDLEARRRAVTFYPLGRKPHAMLPEPLSHGECSLRCGQECLAFSVFFKFNKDGTQVEELEPAVKRTVIKSCRQLTYEEAQKVIDKDASVAVELPVQNDIRLLHMITSKLRENRQKQSLFFVPFEDPRLPELEKLNDHIEAHSLIEELMILANSTIARRLSNSPRHRDVMLVRCHNAPSFEELAEWREKEGSISSLVMQLQGKTVTPNSQLSLQYCSTVTANPIYQQHVVVQRDVWRKLCRHQEEGELAEARRLACMDALHPLQCLAASHWMELMETAQYKCCYGLNRPDLRHFGLDLEVYTHFTSPIRRYADIHVQRLLHAYLDGKNLDCTPDFVTELCQQINSATCRQKAFGKGCMALKVAESLQKQPLVFRAFVESVDTEQLTLHLPSLLKVKDRRQEVPFSMLGVSCQPELTTDTALRQDSVTVQWNKRIYDVKGVCPRALIPFWKGRSKVNGKQSSGSVDMTINPNLLTVSIRQQDWANILKSLILYGQSGQNCIRIPQPVSRDQSEVDDMSSEKEDGTVSLRPVRFQRVYTSGQVLQVQMSAEPKKGLLVPRVEIVHTARNTSACTQHVTDPVQALTRSATTATRGQHFSKYKDYVQAWMPLLEMEAATGAGDSDGGVVIDNVTVTIKVQAPSTSLRYRASFSLPAQFCYDRCIEFGGKSANSIREDEYRSDNSFPLDYLCLRYKMNCPDSVRSRVRQSQVSEAVDGQFTWVAHASVVDVIHTNRRAQDGGRVMVTIVLSPSSPQPPLQLMSKEGASVTVEILPKSDVDRRAQQLLLELQDAKYSLARDIAFGKKITELDADHRRLGQNPDNHDIDFGDDDVAKELSSENDDDIPKIFTPPRIFRNNSSQRAAIEKAMTCRLAIIQGPPGTGKTVVGIKLVYLFCKVNRQLQAEGKGKKTVLYCGPSNKSVDHVARELINKLGMKCPKIIRVYGSTIEDKDYPVPRGDLRSTRGMRNLKSDPMLVDVTLHHVIREDGKPYARKLAAFDKFFEQCRKTPDKYSVSNQLLKKYYNLLHDASVEELQHYQVVLATCAVGGNKKLVEGTKKSVFQVIIDECAMCPEPHSMVPIIANQAKQLVLIGDHKQLRPIIKCQAAAELGLDQSLFERLITKDPTYKEFLKTQYRMHPKICQFPSEEFYDGELKTGQLRSSKGLTLRFWPGYRPDSSDHVPHLLIDVRGEEETLTVTTDQGNERSKSNSLEADKVLEIVMYLRQCRVELKEVKLLTQYNAQRHLLEEKMKAAIQQNGMTFNHYDRINVENITASTIVSSQGGEWDYVILSTVRSMPSYKIEPSPTHGWCRQNLGFITDRNQMNVALTRARKGLIIVGNVELLRCDEVWGRLVERYEQLGCYIQDASRFPPPPPPTSRKKRWEKKPVTHNSSPEEWRRD